MFAIPFHVNNVYLQMYKWQGCAILEGLHNCRCEAFRIIRFRPLSLMALEEDGQIGVVLKIQGIATQPVNNTHPQIHQYQFHEKPRMVGTKDYYGTPGIYYPQLVLPMN